MECSSSELSSSPESRGPTRASAASRGRQVQDPIPKAPPARATPRVPKACPPGKPAAKKPAAAGKRAGLVDQTAAATKATPRAPKACPQGQAATASSDTTASSGTGTASDHRKAAAAGQIGRAPGPTSAKTSLGQDDVAAASGSRPPAPAAEKAAPRRQLRGKTAQKAQQNQQKEKQRKEAC